MEGFLHQKVKKVQLGPFPSSDIEIRDIIKAWIAISIVFAIVQVGFSSFTYFMYGIILSAVTVGLGFLLHELAHKVVAQRYGCFAEFRAFDQMLIFMILMSFLGIVFAAPGAVMINGPVGTRRNGLISIAGPVTNLVLALIFIANYYLFPTPLVQTICFYGFVVNTWLALFNMIPFWMFDGAKIWRWNKVVWIVTVLIGAGLMVFQSYLPVPELLASATSAS